jgi:hypothetical protein
MTAQTLGNPLADRPLVLNGPLVRLGLAEDALHERSGVVHVGFELETGSTFKTGPAFGEEHGAVAIGSNLRVGSHNELEVVRTDLAVTDQSGVIRRLEMIERSRSAALQAVRASGVVGSAAREAVPRFPFGVSGSVPPNTVGARARQLFPDQLGVTENDYLNEFVRVGWLVRYPELFGDQNALRNQVRQIRVSPAVRTLIREYMATEFESDRSGEMPAGRSLQIGDLLDAFDADTIERISEIPTTRWFEHREDIPWKGAVRARDLVEPFGAAIENVRRWFATSVRHLGPLRAAPRPLYELPEAASGLSVGRNGEYTAAVLSSHARQEVEAPDPRTGEVVRLPLLEAVNRWVSEMELLSSVASQERGKLGYELHLAVDGVSRELDLTSVGVGVSQALPVVVLGLISEPGSVLLFEQPELHLHPDVQASLGDFFLALAVSGRQVIVETHSEYLVNRLRRRAIEGSTDAIDLTRLFFFERSRGSTTVRASAFGSRGETPDWPRGFLDTATREIEAIGAALQRRHADK